jgi:hypothetical protein
VAVVPFESFRPAEARHCPGVIAVIAEAMESGELRKNPAVVSVEGSIWDEHRTLSLRRGGSPLDAVPDGQESGASS